MNLLELQILAVVSRSGQPAALDLSSRPAKPETTGGGRTAPIDDVPSNASVAARPSS